MKFVFGLKVYNISRGSLKTANKQYSKLNNDYEMTFSSETVIQPCEEEDNLPHISYTLCPLSDVASKSVNDIVGKKYGDIFST